MKIRVLLAASAAVCLLSVPSFAQNTGANTPATQASSAQQQSAEGLWRASKLHGIDVYNQQNEKIGDIDDVLMDKDGKAKLAVLGVGGFLGMGEHNVAVNFSELKFSDQAVKSTTSGSNADTNKSVRKNYPDHAVFSATK